MARSLWNGFLSFGLISIPVELVSALKEKEITFHKINKPTGNPVQQKLVDPAARVKREIPKDKIEKGVEVAPAQHIVVTKPELAAIKPKTTKELEIASLIDRDAVDPIFYDKPYYLLPKTAGEKSYALLVRAMSETGKAAVSVFCMRGKEYLTLIRPIDCVLSLQTLKFPDEIIPVQDLAYKPVVVDDKELNTAKRLVTALSEDYNPQAYRSQYLDQLRTLVREKIQAHDVTNGTMTDDSLLEPLQASGA